MRGENFDRLETLCRFIIQEMAKIDKKMVYLDYRIPGLGDQAKFILDDIVGLDRKDNDLNECGLGRDSAGSPEDFCLRDDNNVPLNADGSPMVDIAYDYGEKCNHKDDNNVPLWAEHRDRIHCKKCLVRR